MKPSLNKKEKLNQKQSERLLAAVIFARATSFLLVKTCLKELAVLTLLADRFILAGILLCLIFHKKLKHLSRRVLFHGFLLGAAFFAVMVGETIAIEKTNSSTTALIESTAIMLVPLFVAAHRRRLPARANLISAIVAFCGVALTIVQGGSFVLTPGIIWCLATAVLYAVSVILTDVLSKKDDAVTLGVLQVVFMGLLSVVFAFITGVNGPVLPQSGRVWAMLLYLAVVCSVFGFAIQPVAQAGTTSTRASLFLAITPATATVLGVLILHEPLTPVGAVGCVLILASFFIANRPQREIKP